jgi:hypothetical protein
MASKEMFYDWQNSIQITDKDLVSFPMNHKMGAKVRPWPPFLVLGTTGTNQQRSLDQ